MHSAKDTSNTPRRAHVQRLGIWFVLSALLLGGCESLGYYSQAIRGQLAVTFARVPVTRLLNEPTTPESLKGRLRATQAMLSFIETELGLPAKRRYRSYVALDRDAVLYNLVATPALSLKAHQWCYPIAGCAPYRGYFKLAAAQAAASRHQQRGFTTYIGRVPAYSTLGWFKDPLLSSFIHWNDAELMALLSHELSHSRVWVDSDVGFNEAFATFVGEQATRQWLAQSDPALLDEYQSGRVAWLRLVGLQQQLKAPLNALYESSAADADKRSASDALYAVFRQCYTDNKVWLGNGRYDAYVAAINDASLAALATYREQVPAFASLFAEQGGRWPDFFAAVDAIAQQPAEQRKQSMLALRPVAGRGSSEQQVTHTADDQGPKQVQCQAFASHDVNGHLP